MRPRTQKQPQVKNELCRALDDVDVDVDILNKIFSAHTIELSSRVLEVSTGAAKPQFHLKSTTPEATFCFEITFDCRSWIKNVLSCPLSHV